MVVDFPQKENILSSTKVNDMVVVWMAMQRARASVANVLI